MKYYALISRFNKGSDNKYIIVQNKSETEAYIVSGPFDHKIIFEDFQSWVSKPEDYIPCGGGLLQISDTAKEIFTRGKSKSYGKPQKDLVQRILESEYPDYNITVTISDYVQE